MRLELDDNEGDIVLDGNSPQHKFSLVSCDGNKGNIAGSENALGVKANADNAG